MRKGTLIQTAMWAVGTCGLTLALIGPSHLQADGPEEVAPAMAVNQRPITDASGAVLSLAFADKDAKCEAGKPLPAINLIATAPADKDVTLRVKYTLFSMENSPFTGRRSDPMPGKVTSDSVDLVLKAGETKTVALAIKADLMKGNDYSVQLSSSDMADGQLVQPAMAFSLSDSEQAAQSILYEEGKVAWTTSPGPESDENEKEPAAPEETEAATRQAMIRRLNAVKDQIRMRRPGNDAEMVPIKSITTPASQPATQPSAQPAPSTQPVDPPVRKNGPVSNNGE